MPDIREQAIALINEASEDDVVYYISFIRDHQREQQQQDAKREAAWERLMKYHKSVHRDIDCKAELAKYREERYANPNARKIPEEIS